MVGGGETLTSDTIILWVYHVMGSTDCYRRIMIAIQSAGSSNIVQHLFSAYNYEFD